LHGRAKFDENKKLLPLKSGKYAVMSFKKKINTEKGKQHNCEADDRQDGRSPTPPPDS